MNGNSRSLNWRPQQPLLNTPQDGVLTMSWAPLPLSSVLRVCCVSCMVLRAGQNMISGNPCTLKYSAISSYFTE